MSARPAQAAQPAGAGAAERGTLRKPGGLGRSPEAASRRRGRDASPYVLSDDRARARSSRRVRRAREELGARGGGGSGAAWYRHALPGSAVCCQVVRVLPGSTRRLDRGPLSSTYPGSTWSGSIHCALISGIYGRRIGRALPILHRFVGLLGVVGEVDHRALDGLVSGH